MGNFQGWLGEKIVIFNMWLHLNAKTYQRMHNVIVPSKKGTAQIDHLLVSPYGIFIVETKNRKGWIFGSSDESRWVQVLFRTKYFFQNPTWQIYGQKSALSEYLNIDAQLIHSIVYFVGNCEFKTDMPTNVINSGLCSYIEKYQDQLLNHEEINCILKQLTDLKSDPSLTSNNHIKSLYGRHASITFCPKCGFQLLERNVKNGSEVGSKFLGCKNYPQCRFTKNYLKF